MSKNLMDFSRINSKWMLLLPPKIREKMKAEKGNFILFFEKDDEIVIKTMNDEEFKKIWSRGNKEG